MILQRDLRLRQPIRDHGCYFMSLLFLANKYANTQMSIQKINNAIYYGAIQQGYMTAQCYIEKPGEFLKWMGWSAKYMGKHETPDYVCGPGEAEILYFYHPEAGGHFTVGNGAGIVTYDPWGVSRSATAGILKSKRIFTFK